MENLIQKLGTGIVYGAIGLGSLVLGGCESPEGNMTLATLGNMTQANPRATSNDRIIGAGASTIGQMGYQMDVAKEGKSEVNVNVQGNSDQKTQYINIINLDTDKSIQMPSWNDKAFYSYLNSQGENFPKKGYLAQKMEGNRCLESWVFLMENNSLKVKDDRYIRYTNLDTGKIEKTEMKSDAYFGYLLADKKNFPKKGYLVEKMDGDKCLESWVSIFENDILAIKK